MDFVDLNLKAIKAALRCQWHEACRLNEEILKQEPENIEALSRLAKVCFELNNTKKATSLYRKILRLDRFNSIAKRALIRLKNASKKTKQNQSIQKQVKTSFFIEEPSKTKTVALVKTCEANVLSEIDVGDLVNIKVKKYSVCIYNQEDRYLGRLPDDLSSRLIKLINHGNKYAATVKLVDQKSIQIFIREVKQSKKNADVPSFPSKITAYHTFLSPEAIPQEPLEIEEDE